MDALQKKLEQERNEADQNHSMDKKGFLVFIYLWFVIVLLKYREHQKGLRWSRMLPGDY